MPKKKPDIDRVFHALGDPTRRAIVEKLSQGPQSVSRLAAPLDMLFRPEDEHRASGVDDVVPPVSGRDTEVHDPFFADQLAP